ncbi:TIGR03086 family metal-binding protein [Actinomycetes bacterium KLBMP 9797]
MTEVDLLAGVLSKTGDLIDGIRADQLRLPTPCDDYDVEALRDHIVGWVQVFAASAHGRSYPGDPAAYRCGADPAGTFRTAAADLVDGWATYGLDRQVTLAGGALPGDKAFNMAVMEYLTHGWDLAVATGQPVPFTEPEAAEVLARAEVTLPPQYRGENMAFGHIVPVDEDASAIDRMVAFMGRQPAVRKT